MAHELRSAFTYPNELVKFSRKDLDGKPNRTVNHGFYLESVETEVRGIYTQIYSTTICPRCREHLKFVRSGTKTKCVKCGLWMASEKEPRQGIFRPSVTIADLIVWDE